MGGGIYRTSCDNKKDATLEYLLVVGKILLAELLEEKYINIIDNLPCLESLEDEASDYNDDGPNCEIKYCAFNNGDNADNDKKMELDTHTILWVTIRRILS